MVYTALTVESLQTNTFILLCKSLNAGLSVEEAVLHTTTIKQMT